MFLRNQVFAYSVFQMAYGLTFWTWAVYNVFNVEENAPSVSGGVDYGIFTFSLLFFAGFNGMTSIRNPHVRIATKHAKAHLILTIISHVLVSINYIIGAIIGTTGDAQFKLYCYGMAIFFAVSGLLFTYLAFQWRASFQSMHQALALN